MSFRISLKNPSRNPAPPVQSIKIKVQEGIEFVESALKLPGANDYAADSTAPVRQQYPMYIDEPRFTVKKIGQDSPWPCDLNTIQVSLVSSVSLLSACSPTITIQGITGMRTRSSVGSNLTVTDLTSSTARTGVWRQDTGTLEIKVSDFGAVVDSLNFSFVLRNPSATREPLAVSVKGVIFSAVHQSVRQPITPPCSSAQNVPCTESFENFNEMNYRDRDFGSFDRGFALATDPITLCPPGCANSTLYCNTTTNQPTNCTLCPPGCNKTDTRPALPGHQIGRAHV